jgi:hypothetical protein
MAMKHPVRSRPTSFRRPGLLWSRLHFLVRFLGLTGAVAALVGLVLLEPGSWLAIQDIVVHTVQGTDMPADEMEWLGAYLLTVGAAAVALAVFVEALVVLFGVAGRRSAFGFNAVVQALMAAALVVGVNWWSFEHPLRFDCTREGLFTLPSDLRDRLRELDAQGKTTVVVYLRHKTFGALSDKPDRFDYAAERKVVEKIKDLVALLREVGPRLSVDELDVEQEGFDDKLKKLTAHAPELRKAIENAPENSIFISNRAGAAEEPKTPEYVQRMSFNELYQLDKVKSREENDERGNLVLLGQGTDGRGIRPFVRRIVNLEQRPLRVGVLVIHQLLSTRGLESSLTLAGLRKALTMHGFEVKDVVLKKGWERGGFPQAAADTFEESKLTQLEAEQKRLDVRIARLEQELKTTKALVTELTPQPNEDLAKRLKELSDKYREELGGRKMTAEIRARSLALEQAYLEFAEQELARAMKERDSKLGESKQLDEDRISEARRMTDLQAKLTYALADCDLLIIPRLTRQTEMDAILPRLYRLDAEQVEPIRNFLASGKPILACFGPLNEAPDLAMRLPPNAPPAGPDALERLLGELGIHMGRQTILTDTDSKAFTERGPSSFLASETGEVPPLDFESPVDDVASPWRVKGEPLPANPLRTALRVMAHSAGTAMDIRLRFARPIYYEPRDPDAIVSSAAWGWGNPGHTIADCSLALWLARSPILPRPKYDPTFLLSPAGWNEEQPYPTEDSVPQFTRPRPNDPNNDTVDARRRGQFPVGVAVEAPLPKEWRRDGKNSTVRVAAIGQGGIFVGSELSPARERLLLLTTNWLLDRDDYLPKADHPAWSYPRLSLVPEARNHKLWLWGTRLGLPVLFAYLGFVLLLYRRLR